MICYLESDTKSTRLTVVQRSGGSIYSAQFRDLGERLQYNNFFDLFLELPGSAWTGLLSIDTTFDEDKLGAKKGKGGDNSNEWKSMMEKDKPYLAGGGLIVYANPDTMGNHQEMINSIIKQLDFLCIRPGSIFTMPDAEQAVRLLQTREEALQCT
jgi:hypothetical protein